MIEKKMTNVVTQNLSDYIRFFAYRRNWRVEHGRPPTNRTDAESILCDLLKAGVNPRRIKGKQELDLPQPSPNCPMLSKLSSPSLSKIAIT